MTGPIGQLARLIADGATATAMHVGAAVGLVEKGVDESRMAEAFRFGMVGIANTATGLAVIMIGLAAGLGDIASNVLGYAIGFTQGFVLNRRWTFDHRERLSGDLVGRYAVAFGIAYLANLAVVLALTASGTISPVAQLVAAAVYTGLFFILCRGFVFVPRARLRATWLGIASYWNGHFGVLLLVVAVVLYAVLRDIPLGHDQSWYLISVKKFLAGARLYIDIIEINPPLAFFLATPPVFLAEHLGIPAEQLYIAYVMCLAWISTLWARNMLLKIPGVAIAQANGAALIALISTTAVAVYDFGQRDVLLVMFALPYLALSMCRFEGVAVRPRSAIAVGLWAAVGFCLKPYFLIFPLATEVALYLRRKRIADILRPEVVIVGLVCAIYALLVIAFFPAYLDTIVPLGDLTYFAYGIRFPFTLFSADVLTTPLVVGAYLVMRRRGDLPAIFDMLVAWIAAAFISYLVQNKGFTYHAQPLRILLILLAGGLLARKADKPATLPRVVLVAGLLVIALRIAALGLYDNKWAGEAEKRLAQIGVRDGLYTFTAHVFIGFPLANHIDGPWVSRFPCLWPVPGIQRILAAPEDFTPKQVAAAKRADRYVTDAVVEDFERQLPSVVIVDARPDKAYFDDVKFDYVAHFLKDPRFARLWRNYRLVSKAYGFEIWHKASTGHAAH